MSEYQQLAAQFRRVRRAWRRAAVLSGAAIVVSEGCGILAVLLLLDWLYKPLPTMRVAMWSLALIGIAYLLIRHVAAPLARRISDEQIALYIEEHRAELDGVMITAAEYGHKEGRQPGQAAMVDALLKEASARSARTAASRVVDLSRLKKYGIAAIAGVGLYVVAGLLFPSAIAHHVGRVLTPWQATTEDLPMRSPEEVLREPIRFTLSSGDARLVRGASFGLEVTLSRAPDQPVRLSFRPANAAGQWQEIPLAEIEKLNAFKGALADVSEDLDFYVACGPDKSDTHRIAVYDPLVVQALEVVTHYPDYAGIPDRVERPSSGDVQALVGSTVTVRILTSTPLKQGRITWSDGRTQDMTVDPQVSATATVAFQVVKDADYNYAITDVNDQQARSASPLSVHAIPDAPPTIQVLSPHSPVTTQPIGEVDFQVEAADDFGVEGVDLVYSRLDEQGKPYETRVPLALEAAGSKPALHAKRATCQLMLEDARPVFKPEDAVTYRLEARDAKGQKAASQIGYIIIGYFEFWTVWGALHPGSDTSGAGASQPDLMDMLSLVKTLDEQKPAIAPADFKKQSEEMAGLLLDPESGRPRINSLISISHYPRLAMVAGRIATHVQNAHDSLVAADTAAATDELGAAAIIYAGYTMLEDMAINKHTGSGTFKDTIFGMLRMQNMLEQRRMDALSASAQDEARREEAQAESQGATEAGQAIDDLVRKQDEVISKAAGRTKAPPPADNRPDRNSQAAGADGQGQEPAANPRPSSGGLQDVAAAQRDVADKTKAAAAAVRSNPAAAAEGSRLRKAADQVADASRTMGDAARDFESGRAAEGEAKATKAKAELQAAGNTLRDTNRDKLEAEISKAEGFAAALLDRQRDLRSDTQSVAKELDGGKTPDQRQRRDLQKQAFQQTGLRADAETLVARIDSLGQWAEQVGQPEAIRSLTEAQRAVRRGQPEAKMANAVVELGNANPGPAAEEQQKAESALEKILENLRTSADALAASRDAQLRRAARAADEVKQGLDQLANAGQAAGGQPQNGKEAQANAGQAAGGQPQNGKEAQANAGQAAGGQPQNGKEAQANAGQAAGGQSQEGKANQANAGQAAGGQSQEGKANQANAGQAAESQANAAGPQGNAGRESRSDSGGGQQASQKLSYDIMRLASGLDNRDLVPQSEVERLKEMSLDKSELEKRLAVDPKALKNLSDLVARIRNKLEAEIEAKTEANKLFSSEREECPPVYRQLVNKYFEALSQVPRPAGQGTKP